MDLTVINRERQVTRHMLWVVRRLLRILVIHDPGLIIGPKSKVFSRKSNEMLAELIVEPPCFHDLLLVNMACIDIVVEEGEKVSKNESTRHYDTAATSNRTRRLIS